MTATDPAYGMKALELARELRKEGIRKILILMRHSERHYDEAHLEREPLMWLTEDGKRFANNFGRQIPSIPLVRFYSSMLGRCIETAYQIDKGVTARGGRTESNVVTVELAPSFVRKPLEVFRLHRELGTRELFTRWFAGSMPDHLVARTDEVAGSMARCLVNLLRSGPDAHIDIAVSHDWNLYMVKHHFLGLALAQSIIAEYLEGIVIFEKSGTPHIVNHETGPKPIDIS